MDRQELAAHLEHRRITGNVATPRENNLAHIGRFLDGERGFDFGVELTRDWDEASVFNLMVERVGILADPGIRAGQDTISTDLCLDALGRFSQVLRRHVSARSRVLFASGHPAGMAPGYMRLAAAARAAGAEVVTAPGGIRTAAGGDALQVNGVWLWHQHGGLPHTHFAEPMHAVLDALGPESQPDLVVADHGWAGAAGTRGRNVIGFADCNDPALFVAEAQGQVEVTVPLDDDVVPQFYEPMFDYIAERAGLR